MRGEAKSRTGGASATRVPSTIDFRHKGSIPRDTWRVQCDGTGRFDEIVVGKFLHAEMMDNRSCWLQVCGHCFWVKLDRNGFGTITFTEDRSDHPAYSGKPKP